VGTEREEELLRLNAELAAEIRRLGAGEIGGARSGQAPSARRLSRLIDERDELLAGRDELLAERKRLQEQLDEQRQQSQALEGELHRRRAENAELAQALARLRGSKLGLARWLRARLLRGR
jgi:predicted nuclease with TOPRIM domain